MTDDLGPARTFFQFMDAVMASDLTPNQRLILIAQAKHADTQDGMLRDSYPSEATLARETGLNRKTLQRERPKLVELGWLTQTHSGRGGSSKLSNSYDLAVPDGADSKRHGDALQSDMVSSQSDTVSRSKRHAVATSTSSSIPRSTPPPTSEKGRINQPSEGTKEGRGDSYWVGYSKKHPDGYFHRAEDAREPKGPHVLVTLTRTQVINLLSVGYEYDHILAVMLDYAREAGLRPPIQAGTVPANPVPATGAPARKLLPVGMTPEQVAYSRRSKADRVREYEEHVRQMDALYGLPPRTNVIVR